MTGAAGAARTEVAETAQTALAVEGLAVRTAQTTLLHGIDLHIAPGERVGLIGESGSGKSLTASAVMGLLPEGLRAQGSVRLGDSPTQLLGASESTLSRLRGAEMAMVFQEPMTALNPLMTVGRQVAEIMTQHGTQPSRAAAHGRAVELLDRVRIPDPARAARAYPHQLSGGQRQRVMIAMAMANHPRLLLCDEPTTALDVTVQAEVLRLIDDLVTSEGTALLFITHDLAVVASVCERVLVMHRGCVVETGTVRQVLTAPTHPYTQRLVAASDLTGIDLARAERRRADLARTGSTSRDLTSIPPVAATPPAREHAAEREDDPDHVFNQAPGEPLVKVRSLVRSYRRSGGALFTAATQVHALREVSFDVAAGQRFGIVGESGSGKSTLLRLLCALDRPTSGDVTVAGQSISGAPERALTQFRRDVQIVFQDPMASLDPRMRVGAIVAEPLGRVDASQRRDRVATMLTDVGLSPDVADRYPHQFSGGQRQRISIARALVTRPKVLVADEPVSALDVSVRATVLDLLADLVDQHALTLIFVSHDLSVVRHVCDTVAVVSRGRVVECGPTEAVYNEPRHPYTQQLVASSPSLSAALAGEAR